MDCGPPDSSVHGDSLGKNTGVACLSLLQGIFPTQGSNPGLRHCRWILYYLSHKGSPRKYMELVEHLLSGRGKPLLQTFITLPLPEDQSVFSRDGPGKTSAASQPRPIPKPVVRSGPGRVVALSLQSTDEPASWTSPLDVAQALTTTVLQPSLSLCRVSPPTLCVPRTHWPPPWLCLTFFFRPRLVPAHLSPPSSLLHGLPLQELVFCFTHDSVSSFSQRPKSPPAWP